MPPTTVRDPSSHAARRLGIFLRHISHPSQPDAEQAESGDGSRLAAVPTSATASMISSVLPLLALGGFSLYQSRKANSESEKRILSKLEELAEDHGFDAERLKEIGTWAKKLTDSKKLPGIVLAVARKGEVVFHEAYGDTSYQRDCIFSIKAMAMPIIAAALLSLIDEGKAGIDDDVTKFMPYFSKFQVYQSGRNPQSFKTAPLSDKMTLRHLLTSTWGFPGSIFSQSSDPAIRALDAMASQMKPVIGNDADFEKLTEIPLIGRPGHCYRFGSIVVSVIGHIICKITGRSLREVVHNRVLAPLEMTDTDWFVPHDKMSRVPGLAQAVPWLTNRLWGTLLTGPHAGHTSWMGWVGKTTPSAVPESVPSELNDEAGLYSTALDQLKFHAMLLKGGEAASGRRILSPESVRLMTTDQLPLFGHRLADEVFNTHARDRGNSGGAVAPQFGVKAEGQGVSCGLQVVTRPFASRLAGSKGTFSSWGYHGTECWSDPALEMSIFVGTQLFPFWALPDMRQEAAGSVYGSMVSTAAAKHIVTPGADGGGAFGNIMNMMMMMSMFGGLGGMGGMGGMGAPAGGAGAQGSAGSGGGGGGVGT